MCMSCKMNVCEDKMHFIMICPKYISERIETDIDSFHLTVLICRPLRDLFI